MKPSALPLLAVLALVACTDTSGPDSDVFALRLTPSEILTLHNAGDTARIDVRAVSRGGQTLTGVTVAWASSDPEVVEVSDGLVTAVSEGSAVVSASAGSARAELSVVVAPDGGGAGVFEEVGLGYFADRTTSDLWVFGDYAYTGTHVREGCNPVSDTSPCGNLLVTWDVSDPAAPILVDTLRLDAAVVNDVKVSADGSFAVATHEGSRDGQNGITLLDLSTPSKPAVLKRYTRNLESGVHNVWIERIDGRDYVFAVADGGQTTGGVRILDVTDRADPREVASFFAGSSFAHDVYVRDGLAFVSHWNAGLVILDVGNGVRGGSPASPVEVSRIVTRGGNVHNAWYWPARGYVFVGQEEFPPPGASLDSMGVVHVVDVRDMAAPREVATVSAPDATPHNFWLDEEDGVLFVGWYGAGLRAVDVRGELQGRLETQGRVLAFVRPEGPRGRASFWAPQLHRGLVFASDIRHGIWAFRFVRQ